MATTSGMRLGARGYGAALLFTLLSCLVACYGSLPASAQLTNAELVAAGSPELRTLDNTGFVDPGGRTREVRAGIAPASGGWTGIPPPARERPIPERRAVGPPKVGPGRRAPVDPIELDARVAQALCDLEAVCGRVGAGKAWESLDACTSEQRVVVRNAREGTSCVDADGDGVAACLTAIRQAPCESPPIRTWPPADCAASSLCGRIAAP